MRVELGERVVHRHRDPGREPGQVLIGPLRSLDQLTHLRRRIGSVRRLHRLRGPGGRRPEHDLVPLVRELVTGAGQPFEVVSLPQMAHSMHGQDPRLCTKLLTDWVQRLGTP